MWTSHYQASISNIENTDLVFANDAEIFAESLDVLVMAKKALQRKRRPWNLRFPGPIPRFKCLAAY